MMARMQKAPPPLRTLVPSIPEPVEQIVSKCVQPDPDHRYATTAELVADLERLDNSGNLIVAKTPRLGTRTAIAVSALAAVALVAVVWLWLGRSPAPEPAAREPLSILIADFDNQAQEPVFEGALEQALGIAMEGAAFITSYSRTSAQAMLARTNEKTLNDRAGRLIGLREGVKVVLAGVVARSGDGYDLALRAINVADGQEIASVSAAAGSKAEVLGAVAELATDMREELGDTKGDAGAETLTASTLEAVRNYSIAQDFAARGRFEDAIKHYEAAIRDDPKFGRAYSGLATGHFYLGRREAAQKYWDEALKYMDAMTEREKYRTRGTYFLAVGQDYDQAIDEYSTLVKLYPADRVGHNNLAFAYFSTLNFPKALEEGRRARELAPNHLTIRNNYAMYAMYASDFDTALREAEEVLKLDASFAKAYLVRAMAALVKGDESAARQAYADMAAKTDTVGASMANLGLADIEMYKGRWTEAERLLKEGLEADRRANNQDSVEAKSVALAEIDFNRGDSGAAKATAATALKAGTNTRVAVPVAEMFAALGDGAEAQRIASGLKNELQRQLRAYGNVIDGDVALAQRKLPDSIDAYRKALETADLWLARLRLGIAYVEAERFVAALTEFELCEKRRGEAMSLFLDDLPTFRYLAVVPYWKGRAYEGAPGQSANARASYDAFLKIRAGASDPLVRDAETRRANLR
jgi:tetratricopeptide (TPR) repeat protein